MGTDSMFTTIDRSNWAQREARQTAFDVVAAHLLKQKAKARGPAGCQYRADNNTKMCAVGCLIKDEVYTEDLEGKQADTSPVLAALEASGVNVEAVGSMFFYSLQILHDTHMPETWRLMLRGFATAYCLDYHATLEF